MKKAPVKKPPVEKAPVKEAPGKKTAPVKKAEHILKGKVANKKAGPVKKHSGEEKEKTRDALKYDPRWKSGPRKYGSVTLYIDTRSELYRIKLGTGMRDHAMRKWGHESWLEVVKIVKALPQC